MLILGEHLLTWEGLERGWGLKWLQTKKGSVNNVHYASILGEPLLTWDGVKGGNGAPNRGNVVNVNIWEKCPKEPGKC